jgi:hypothetical protein
VNQFLRNGAVWLLVVGLFSSVVQVSSGQETPIVFKNAHLVPVDGAEISSGT